MKLSELQKLASTISKTDGPNDPQKIYEYIQAMGLDPNNFYQELEMTSHFVDTHRDTSASNAHVQLHSHTFYELIYCCNSCGAEYLIGPERYRLQQGDLLFVPPGVSHRPLLEHINEPYLRYVIWLSPMFMTQYAGLFPYPFTNRQTYPNLLRTTGSQQEHLGKLFHYGVQEAEHQKDGWEAVVIGNTITLLTLIKRAAENQTAKSLVAEEPELLDRIMAYVEQNYAQNISIKEMAKEFYVSDSTISHLFKKKLEISFYRFVTQRRLIAAKSMIEKGILLESVALQTGFPDYSCFYRAFKQEYGISPRQYRNMQAGAN